LSEARAVPASGGPARSVALDNAKAALIALVVFAHLAAIEMARTPGGRSVYLLILTFHMPAFVFVSGMTSNPRPFTRRGVAGLLTLCWTYLLFNALNYLWSAVARGTHPNITRVLFDPAFALWFLLALVWWRMLLPVFAMGSSRAAAAISVAAALAVSVAAGLAVDGGEWFAFSRTFAFLPFFVAGFRVRQLGIRLPDSTPARVCAVLAFLVVWAAIYLYDPLDSPAVLTAHVGFADMDTNGVHPALARVAAMAIGLGLTAATLTLVPRSRRIFTTLGATTLSVYAWHALAVRNIKYFDLGWLLAGSWLAAAVTTLVMLGVFGFGPVPRVTAAVSGLPRRWLGVTPGERRAEAH